MAYKTPSTTHLLSTKMVPQDQIGMKVFLHLLTSVSSHSRMMALRNYSN